MIGILGGTSFLNSTVLSEGDTRRVVTPWGSVPVTVAGGLAMIARHGVHGAVPPHRINHAAHIATLLRLGVRGIISFGSVGGLNDRYPPGTLALIDDIYAPHRTVSYHLNSMRITIPALRTAWRDEVGAALEAVEGTVVDGGVYAETLGLRFESEAEVRALATLADVVGMTCAAEATLAWEKDMPIAIVASVDNAAHGLGLEPLTGDAFEQTVAANRLRVEAALACCRSL